MDVVLLAVFVAETQRLAGAHRHDSRLKPQSALINQGDRRVLLGGFGGCSFDRI
jgi:hypothetical protein